MPTPASRLRITVVLVSAFSLLLIGLVSATGQTAQAADDTFTAAGSARQVYATGLAAGSEVSLLDSTGATVKTQTVNALGGVLFRNVKPAAGYVVKAASGTTSDALTVHTNTPKQWNKSIYDQTIPSDGYGYLTTRDGTKLAYDVHAPYSLGGVNPGPPIPAGAPVPTLVEYAGYGYANPSGPDSGIAAIANAMGFAVVDIQMRGTGCSGGAFDFYEPLQSIDGYDIIETVARQSWVQGGKVGMMGISYGGITQLFTAATRPPHLAAISPLSTIDATATTLYPGGVLNTGFAVAWAKERQDQAQAAGTGAEGTQAYAEQQIADGDQTCKDNQVLHPEAADLMAKIRANSHYKPKVADPLDPVSFVHKIDVPTFMACQFEDEQTGGHCPSLVSHMTGTKKKWFTFTNGAHIDSLDPETLNRLYDFWEIYVANEAPITKSAFVQNFAAPVIYQQAMGIPASDPIRLPPDPVQQQPTLDAAQTMFEGFKSVRILFDNGAGTGPTGTNQPGDPYPGYEKSFASLPVKGTRATSFYLGGGSALHAHAPARHHVDRYTTDPSVLPGNDFTGGTSSGALWGNASQWSWDWKQRAKGTAVSYVSPKLKKDLTAVGAGAVQLWVRSSAKDADFQATVSEVSGKNETFVQSGWLRGSMRKLATTKHNIMKQKPTLLQPVPTMRQSDVKPLSRHRWTKIVIPLYYEGHAYRKGTRIRVTISAPGGEQPIWSFAEAKPSTPSKIWVASSKKHPSRLVLPVIPGVTIDSPQPPCPGLRNEPCRAYVPFTNQ